jgi:hypothetical protein
LKTAGVLFSVDMGNPGISTITQVEALATLNSILIGNFIPPVVNTA